ncbi:DUF6461 domain-containing protein [Yinghuangia aomiensis]
MGDIGLGWIFGTYDVGFGLLAVRDVTPERALARLGVPVAEQVLLTAEEARRLADGGWKSGARAGTGADGWTFVIDQAGVCASSSNVAAVSRGTEAAAYAQYIDGMAFFRYARDGRLEFSFEPRDDNVLEECGDRAITESIRAVLASGPNVRMGTGLALLHDAFGVRIRKEDEDKPLPGGVISRK